MYNITFNFGSVAVIESGRRFVQTRQTQAKIELCANIITSRNHSNFSSFTIFKLFQLTPLGVTKKAKLHFCAIVNV